MRLDGEESSYEARIVRAILALVHAQEHGDDARAAEQLSRAVGAAKQLIKERAEFSDHECVARIEYDEGSKP